VVERDGTPTASSVNSYYPGGSMRLGRLKRPGRYLTMTVLAVSLLVSGLVAAAPAAATTSTDTTGAPAGGPKPAGTWAQVMFDAGRTGFNAQETAINAQTVNNLDLDYIAVGPADFEFGRFAGSSPAIADGVAYIGDALGNLLALPATGCRKAVCPPLWSAKL